MAHPEKPPALDVVLTTCRRQALLRQALQSVCAQSFDDFRVFVVNDEPDDRRDIEAIVAGLADRRIRLISPGTKFGANRARNLGIAAGTAPLVAFIDDDDLWLPSKLARHVEAHRRAPGVGMVYSDFVVQLDRPVRLRLAMGGEAVADAPVAAIATSRVTVRRQALESVNGFDPDLVAYQDFDIWYRLMQRWPASRLPEVLNVIRIHDGERITQLAPVERGGEQIVKKYARDKAIDRLRHMVSERNFFLAIREQRQRSWIAALRYALGQDASRSMRLGGCLLAIGGEPAYQCGRALFRYLAAEARGWPSRARWDRPAPDDVGPSPTAGESATGR